MSLVNTHFYDWQTIVLELCLLSQRTLLVKNCCMLKLKACRKVILSNQKKSGFMTSNNCLNHQRLPMFNHSDLQKQRRCVVPHNTHWTWGAARSLSLVWASLGAPSILLKCLQSFFKETKQVLLNMPLFKEHVLQHSRKSVGTNTRFFSDLTTQRKC